MTKSATLVQVICGPYCRHYKPGKNEELICGGAVVVERLMRSGRRVTIEKSPRPRGGTTIPEPVVRLVCRRCSFREEDCDFAQNPAADPCGGLVLLAQLLDEGLITPGELSE